MVARSNRTRRDSGDLVTGFPMERSTIKLAADASPGDFYSQLISRLKTIANQ